MDLMKLGTELIKNKLNIDADGDGNPDGIMGALSNLLGDTDGNLDLGGIIAKMKESDLGSMVSSWLGDGENDAISTDQIRDLFGGEKVSEFASKLNVDAKQAAEGLAEAVPQMIDKGSSGGELLDSVGGLGGIVDMAKNLFNK